MLFSILTGVLPIENCIASANTIYVDNNNTSGPWNGTQEHPYQYIQDGINAAISGDTVYVYSGIYYENVVISKDITIIGENRDNTIIDGGKNGHVVYGFNGSPGNIIEVNISGFTIKNAGGLGYDCIAFSYINNGTIYGNILKNSDESDGLQLDHCSGLTIDSNLITNNDGAGISLTLSENNVIKNNILQDNQKGIYIYYSSNSNEIYDNKITRNSQYGVYIVQSLNNRFYRNDLTDNGQNAQDPLTNYWSQNGQGNYWDDYGGFDENPKDCLGDSPYYIPGGNNKDEYPLGYFIESEPEGGGNQQPIAYQPAIFPNSAIQGETILFSGSGSDDGYIDGYNWRSSIDGYLSSEREFSLSSLSAGIHTIYFKVRDNEGEWSSEKTAILTINLPENEVPTAYIAAITPNPAKFGEKISFIGHGVDKDGSIIGWKWISNKDGIISLKSSFNTSDLSVGNHTIYFQVKDNDDGWSPKDIQTLSVDLNSSQNQPPIAIVEGEKSGQVNEDISFDASMSYDSDGLITEYLWDFDDGVIGIGISPTHIYNKSGNYTITLTVTDEDGAIGTDVVYITVGESDNLGGLNGGLSDFNSEASFPLIIALVLLCIISLIALFLFWIKRK